MSSTLRLTQETNEVSNVFLNKAWPLQLPPVSKAVLIAMADYADDNGIAWPAIDNLVTRTCFSRRAVQRAIGDLEKSSLIIVGLRKGGFQKQTTVYRLNLPTVDTKDEPEITWTEGRTADASRVSQSKVATVSPNLRPIVADDGLTCAQTIMNHHEPSITIIEPASPLRVVPSDQPPGPSNDQKHDLLSAGQSSEPAAHTKKRSGAAKSPTTRAKAIPADWRPDAGGLAYAAERDINVTVELEKFVDHHLAKGKPIGNVDAAWRTWCRNHVEWGKNRAGNQPNHRSGSKQTTRNPMLKAISEQYFGSNHEQ